MMSLTTLDIQNLIHAYFRNRAMTQLKLDCIIYREISMMENQLNILNMEFKL